MGSSSLESVASARGAGVAPPTDPDRARGEGGAALTLAFLGMATLGFNRTRIAGLALCDLLFLACGAVLVAKLLTGDRRGMATPSARRMSSLVLAGSMLLLTFGALSSLLSWDPLGAMQVVLRFAWLTLVWFWILRSVTPDRAAINKLLSGWRIAILSSSFFAAIGQLGIYQAGILEGEDRQMAFFNHPNELAALLVFGLPLIIFDLPRPPGQAPSTLRRIGLTAFVGFAVMTTGSMTAFFAAVVCLAAAAVAVPVSHGRFRLRRHTGLLAIALVMLGTVGLALVSGSDLAVVERFTRFQEGDSGIEGSIGTRASMNNAVIEGLDDTLFIGTGLQLQGPDRDVTRIGEGATAPGVVEGVHNMFLKLVHEAGVPALVGLLVIIAATLRHTWRTALASRGTDLFHVAVALLAAIVASNTMAQFSPMAYQRYYWAPVAIAGCVWAVRRTELREDQAAQLGAIRAQPGRRR